MNQSNELLRIIALKEKVIKNEEEDQIYLFLVSPNNFNENSFPLG